MHAHNKLNALYLLLYTQCYNIFFWAYRADKLHHKWMRVMPTPRAVQYSGSMYKIQVHKALTQSVLYSMIWGSWNLKVGLCIKLSMASLALCRRHKEKLRAHFLESRNLRVCSINASGFMSKSSPRPQCGWQLQKVRQGTSILFNY